MISDPGFGKKKQTLQQIAERQERRIENNIPANKGYEFYSFSLRQVKSDDLKEYYNAFNHSCGSKDSTIIIPPNTV